MLTKSNGIKLAQVWLSEDRSIWCNKDLFFLWSGDCLACQEGESRLAHGTHAKLSEAPGLRCSVRMGVSVHGMGNQEKCQTTILQRSFSSLSPPLSIFYSLSCQFHSFIRSTFSPSPSSDCPDALSHTHTHTHTTGAKSKIYALNGQSISH